MTTFVLDPIVVTPEAESVGRAIARGAARWAPRVGKLAMRFGPWGMLLGGTLVVVGYGLDIYMSSSTSDEASTTEDEATEVDKCDQEPPEDDCQKQREDAFDFIEGLYNTWGHLPSPPDVLRNMFRPGPGVVLEDAWRRGDYKALSRGLISEKCGGNPVDQGDWPNS